MRRRLTCGVLLIAGAAACSDEPLNEVRITVIDVQPTSGAAGLAALAGAPLTLDIYVEPAFSLDFDPAFGDEPALEVRGQPTTGALVNEGDTDVVAAFDRLILRGPDHLQAESRGLPVGDYRVVLEGGRDGRLESDELLQVRDPDQVGEELRIAGLPSTLLADECQTIEVGFVAEGGTQFVAPPRSAESNEILIELAPDPEGGADGPGLAITPPTACGPEGAAQPSARLSSRNITASWNIRGRTPGLASLGVTATWVGTGGFVDSIEPGESRVRVRGRVAVAPEARLWLPSDSCMGIRWIRRNPRMDDAPSPALDLELLLVDGDGQTVEPTMYAGPDCREVVESARIEAGRDLASTFIRVPALGAYELQGRLRGPPEPANWILESGSFRVVSEIPIGDVEVSAPSVVAFGIPTPVLVESPSPTSCELTLETTLGVPLLDAPVPVELEERELVWVVPRAPGAAADEVQAVARCVEPDVRPRSTGVTVSTCFGLALDPFSLRLDVGNLAPTALDPNIDVSLVTGGGSGPSSVFYAFGDLDSPDRVRLDATGDGASFRWQAPLTGGIEPITAIVRDAFGCPVILEQIVYSGADPSRVIPIGPGALETQLERAGVDLEDSSPLVLLFSPETMLNTVFADGAALGTTAAELVLLGPGSPALLSLTGEWVLRQSSVWSWIDLHGTGKVTATSGSFEFRDSVLREEASLDLFDADAQIGPGAYLSGTRRSAVAFDQGLVRNSFVAGGAGALEGPVFSVGSQARFVQTAVVGLRGPLVAAAFDGQPVTVDVDFSTLHRAAPVDLNTLPGGSAVSLTGALLSRVPDWFEPQLASNALSIRASALVGFDAEPPACVRAALECRAGDLFLDPTAPEWLSYVWCDDVEPRLSDWDKAGFGSVGEDAVARRFFGLGYDVGHLEEPVSTPGACR